MHYSILSNLWNNDTSILWTLRDVPMVSLVERFHCIYILQTSHIYSINFSLVPTPSTLSLFRMPSENHLPENVICTPSYTNLIFFEYLLSPIYDIIYLYIAVLTLPMHPPKLHLYSFVFILFICSALFIITYIIMFYSFWVYTLVISILLFVYPISRHKNWFKNIIHWSIMSRGECHIIHMHGGTLFTPTT